MKSNNFNKKVALVTGGASGIGKACVLAFSDRGAVAVVDFNRSDGAKIVESIKEKGRDAIFLRVDVSDPAAVEKMVGEIVATFGRLDFAVNNAGIGAVGFATASAYVAAKHGVLGLTKAAATQEQIDGLHPTGAYYLVDGGYTAR